MANDLAKGRKVKCKPTNEQKGVQNSVSHFQTQKLSKKKKKNQSPPPLWMCMYVWYMFKCWCMCMFGYGYMSRFV